MGRLHLLETRPARLRRDQASVLRQALLPFVETEMRDTVRRLIGEIDRHTAAQQRWAFIMLSATQNRMVVRHLLAHSERPMVAAGLWSILLEHLAPDTGEIMLSRDELAAEMQEHPAHISTIMSELVEIGAISRRRQKVAGMRGPGIVRYFLSPQVGTHLAGKARDDAQAASPQLTLVP